MENNEYLKRNLKDFYKNETWDKTYWNHLIAHSDRQIQNVQNPTFVSYYKSLKRIAEYKIGESKQEFNIDELLKQVELENKADNETNEPTQDMENKSNVVRKRKR